MDTPHNLYVIATVLSATFVSGSLTALGLLWRRGVALDGETRRGFRNQAFSLLVAGSLLLVGTHFPFARHETGDHHSSAQEFVRTSNRDR
ncbi:hypothetical protein PY650_28860 [Rhizobium calliandrae]|uniref:HIG1 domain-containing protein n=1 Tax=Rhizobium calliandrae TaxID=1312182 RepID=A0ABT7KQN8_9HYPH|nr:hypothetical protein [Rhizobium calliandrae]MDL2409568.1 hypothetical protein [Rhizobium calliandrae]